MVHGGPLGVDVGMFGLGVVAGHHSPFPFGPNAWRRMGASCFSAASTFPQKLDDLVSRGGHWIHGFKWIGWATSQKRLAQTLGVLFVVFDQKGNTGSLFQSVESLFFVQSARARGEVCWLFSSWTS